MNGKTDGPLVEKQQQKTQYAVMRQMAHLRSMSLDELRGEWLSLFGCEAPLYKKQMLVKRLLHRVQELAHGRYSRELELEMQKIAREDRQASLIPQPKKEIVRGDNVAVGTRFVRIWNDKRYEVTAEAEGYEYQGKIYRSLSAVARAITGTRWNGRLFFGLKKDSEKGSGAGVR